MVPQRFYIGLLGFFLAALVCGVLFFIIGMGDATYLVSDGVGYGMHYIDKPKYDNNLQGFIFSLTFFLAGLLLLLLAILPGRESARIQGQTTAPPQPRRRQAAAPQPKAAVKPEPPSPAPSQSAPATSPVEIEATPEAVEPPSPGPKKVEIKRSVEEDVLISDDDVEIEDIPDARYDDTGEENVVYGSGRVTDDSIWEFIHLHPDSSVKFLYRKTLENKSLTPTEEDIYRKWEMRGMTRGKVREYVLEIMGWESLPDDFPHNIWKELRDQIFEIKSRSSAA